ncbi:MAG: glycoside hydrolase family 16 protein [Kiritimatiellae bacterium]|nr:glycoside hydrolase family 16 protein [Kiritimatiellia bacterium]
MRDLNQGQAAEGAELVADACVESAVVAGEAPSLLPRGIDFSLVWHDEFNGDALDASKWRFRTNFWGRRAHWFAAPEDGAVEVRDGVCRLGIVRRPDGQFVSPQLQTGELMWDIPHAASPRGFWPLPDREPPLFVHRYGYYECRCRLQQMPGWWSAFWMQTETQGACLDPARTGAELDIMESFEPGEVSPHCFYTNGYGREMIKAITPAPPPGVSPFAMSLAVDKTQWHTFGLLWEPDGYTVFVDGCRHGGKVGEATGFPVSQVPEFLLISTECRWFREEHATGKAHEGLEAAAAARDAFLVDYVRVFDRGMR